MPQHKQPTQEELNQKIEESLKEVEVEDQKAQEIEEKAKEIQEENQEEVQEEIEEQQEEEVAPSEADKETLKKRYQDSSREALTLHSKNKKLTEAIEKAGEIEVTQEELEKEYPEWEMMTDSEKKTATKTLKSEKALQAIQEATKEFKELDAWNGKVDSYLSDPETLIKIPALEGKEEEFKFFASKESRRGADLTDLANLFILTEGKAKPKAKGSMMPSGTSGANKSKPNDGMISQSEADVLRRTNFKQFLVFLKAKKIRPEA